MLLKDTLNTNYMKDEFSFLESIRFQTEHIENFSYSECLYLYIPLMERLVYEILNHHFDADIELNEQGTKRSMGSLLRLHEQYLIELLGEDNYKRIYRYFESNTVRGRYLKSIGINANHELIQDARDLCHYLFKCSNTLGKEENVYPRIEYIK